MSNQGGFGLAMCKVQGSAIKIDAGQLDSTEPIEQTRWFEFCVSNDRIQEVVDHLAKIGIDCDPRRCL